MGDESFDTVLDKGALDALMEPEVGTKLGSQYLSEVCVLCSSYRFFHQNDESCVLLLMLLYLFYQAKRVLKPGGKFICLTLAESHVLGDCFSLKFFL